MNGWVTLDRWFKFYIENDVILKVIRKTSNGNEAPASIFGVTKNGEWIKEESLKFSTYKKGNFTVC